MNIVVPEVQLPSEIPFKQARDFNRGRRDPSTGKPVTPRNIVIHTAEIGESLEGAEALMATCAKGQLYPPGHAKEGQKRLASWHFAVDANSITQSVSEDDTAFHAPGLSHCSIGIEHAGRARQTAEEWCDDFSLRMLELSAWLVARLCWSYRIPVQWLEPPSLIRGDAGITGHSEVSRAFKRSDHWDPGPNFVRSHYLGRVLFYHRQRDTDPAPKLDTSIAPPLDPAHLEVLGEGRDNSRDAVLLCQNRLIAQGTPISVSTTGVWDEATKEATRWIQLARGIKVEDPIVVGERTWKELLT